MLDSPRELSKVHIGPCDTLLRTQNSNREFHAGKHNHVFHRKVGRAVVAAHLAASKHLGLGLAEHVTHLRRWRDRGLYRVGVSATLAGCQPGSSRAFCRPVLLLCT